MKKQKVIKITEKNRDEVIEYLTKNGNDVFSSRFSIGFYYGIDERKRVVAYERGDIVNFEIVQTVYDLEEKPEKSFPRMMMVGDDKNDLKKGMVFFIDFRKNVPHSVIATKDLDTYRDKGKYIIDGYEFAAEVPDPIKITRAQIKEWVGGEFKIID